MAVVTEPAPTRHTADVDDELHHMYCCDANVAMCGIDLTGHAEVGPTEPVCPLCVLVAEFGLPCPVPGCAR